MTLVRAPLLERVIRGQIVEVLLPRCNQESEKGYLFQKGRIIVKAKTICLQLGDHNTFRNCVVDLAMPEKFSDVLTKVSDDDELVIRVLRRYGESEEFIVMKDTSGISPSIDICADFVRIIPPVDETPAPYLERFAVVSDISTSYAQIGDRNETVITPRAEFCDVLDSTRPILHILRLLTTSPSVLYNRKDFPNFEKDHLVVLKLCKNRFDGRALEYSFQVGESLSSARKKTMADYYDLEVTVCESRQNGKTKVTDEVMFQREQSSFGNLLGLAGFWFRFHRANKTYIITFSLWKKQSGSQQIGFLLDEVHITVETCEEKRLLSKRRRRICPAKERPGEARLPVESLRKSTSLPEKRHAAVERSELTFSSDTSRNQRCFPVPEETKISGEKLPGHYHMTSQKRKQTPPGRKRKQKNNNNSLKQDCFYGENCLPGESHLSVTKGTQVPVNDDESVYEQGLQIMEVLQDFRDDGKWDEFNREADQLLKKHAKNIDLLIAIFLEQGMAACYQNKQTSAEDFIKKASSKIPQASPNLISLWKGRASYYLAGIIRREKMAFGRAQRHFEAAKKHLENTSYLSSVDRAYLAYEEGSLLLDQAHFSSMADKSRRCFDHCIEICSLGLKESTKSHLLIKTKDLAVMKKAMLSFYSRKEYGRSDCLENEEALLEAKQCLEGLKINSVSEMTRIAQVHYHLVRSDQYFREQRLVDAVAHARNAFDLSRRCGFDTFHTAKVRLDFVNKFL